MNTSNLVIIPSTQA